MLQWSDREADEERTESWMGVDSCLGSRRERELSESCHSFQQVDFEDELCCGKAGVGCGSGDVPQENQSDRRTEVTPGAIASNERVETGFGQPEGLLPARVGGGGAPSREGFGCVQCGCVSSDVGARSEL